MGNRTILLLFSVAALSVVYGSAAGILLRIRRKSGFAPRAAVWLLVLLFSVVPLFVRFKPVRAFLFTDWSGGVRVEVGGPGTVDGKPPEGKPPQLSLSRSSRRAAENAALLFLTLWALSASASVSFGLTRYWETLTFLTRHSEECRDERVRRIFEEARKKAGVRRSVTLRILRPELTVSPSACGILSPAVFVGRSLAEEYPDDWLETVFLHELIHIRHRDGLLRAAVLLATSFHALLPVSGRIREAAEEDAEFRCDRDVLRLIGRERTGAYLRMILDAASRSADNGPDGLFSPAAGSGGLLIRRVRRMREEEALGRGRVWIARAAAFLCNLLLLNAVGCGDPGDMRVDFVNPCLADAVTRSAGADDPRELTESALAGVWSLELYQPRDPEGASEGIFYCCVNEERPERSELGEAYPVTADSVRLEDLALFTGLRTLILEGKVWRAPPGWGGERTCAVIIRD